MPFSYPKPTLVLMIRSALFNTAFYVHIVIYLIFGIFILALPRKWAMATLSAWSKTALWLLKIIAGVGLEVRGKENIPTDAAIVAGKHQSLWETFALFSVLDDGAIILKRELMWIPLMGWFSQKFQMIPVDRGAASAALRKLLKSAEKAAEDGRQVLIFPEGTRQPPIAPPAYKPGAAAIYLKLHVPVVPFSLNSGLYWPRRKFLRYPGTIIVEFHEPIPARLPRKEFSAKLQDVIEEGTKELVEEGIERDFKAG